jgi:hypothetical protein
MRVKPLTLLALGLSVAALSGGCGGGSEASKSSDTRVDSTVADRPDPANQYPSLGCDVMPQCSTVRARDTLARCPAESLDPEGQKARKRLERLLVRIEGVDLHNEQAYEAYDAVMVALEDLEAQCL